MDYLLALLLAIVCTSIDTSWILPASSTGFVGLVNQAMTGYLNILLQTLYMTPEFRNALYSWKFKGDPMGAESSKNIPFQLQRLFMQLQVGHVRSCEVL